LGGYLIIDEVNMIDVNDLRKGVTFELNDDLYKVLEFNFNKPGRGNATIRIKARNINSGTIIERTFNSGERVQDVRLEYHTVQFLYADGELLHFMDMQTFEQPTLQKDILGDSAEFLKEGVEVKLTSYKGKPIDAELPTTVDLRVNKAEIAIRGDTATGVTKRVVTETGYSLNVPNFIEEGDMIRIDTRTGEYVTRVKE
jgi:elongation factor P